VDTKKVKEIAEVWGKLPEKERAQAMRDLTRGMPAKDRAVIEAYLKELQKREELPGPTTMSRTIVVVVPSLLHSSVPFAALVAAKYSVPLTSARPVGYELARTSVADGTQRSSSRSKVSRYREGRAPDRRGGVRLRLRR
jgi:hypothetical protein